MTNPYAIPRKRSADSVIEEPPAGAGGRAIANRRASCRAGAARSNGLRTGHRSRAASAIFLRSFALSRVSACILAARLRPSDAKKKGRQSAEWRTEPGAAPRLPDEYAIRKGSVAARTLSLLLPACGRGSGGARSPLGAAAAAVAGCDLGLAWTALPGIAGKWPAPVQRVPRSPAAVLLRTRARRAVFQAARVRGYESRTRAPLAPFDGRRRQRPLR